MGLIYLSAGGTGGHMSPAAALAQALTARRHEVKIITDTRGMKYACMFEDIPMQTVPSATNVPGLIGKIKSALTLIKGCLTARSILKKERPAAVIGFGGYPSVPGIWAAQSLKIPTILHEQNAIIGKANAFLSAKAHAIALPLPKVQGLSPQEQERTHITGNPIRESIAALRMQPYPIFKDTEGILNLLIVGGSLGATVLSKTVPVALKALPEEYRSKLRVVQQCRESDLELTQTLYEGSNIDVKLSSFIDNMAEEINKAHIFIGRSGASTVAEMALAGRPAIYVPYPHHKDQQQKRNAEAIADQGGAWVMSENGFSVDTLKNRLELFFQTPEVLSQAAAKAHACGIENAAEKLADLVETTITKESP